MSRGLVRELVRLGWPVLIAQMAVMANSVIDTIMAGRYGTLDPAAVGIGSSIYFSVFVALMGVVLALTPTRSGLQPEPLPYGRNEPGLVHGVEMQTRRALRQQAIA